MGKNVASFCPLANTLIFPSGVHLQEKCTESVYFRQIWPCLVPTDDEVQIRIYDDIVEPVQPAKSFEVAPSDLWLEMRAKI